MTKGFFFLHSKIFRIDLQIVVLDMLVGGYIPCCLSRFFDASIPRSVIEGHAPSKRN